MKIRYLTFAKAAIYGLFLNFYVFPIFLGRLIPNFSLIMYGIMAVCFLLDSGSKRIHLLPELFWWLLYAVLSVATIAFAQSSSYAISGLIEYGKRLFLIILIVHICRRENSVIFPVSLLIILSVACAVAVLNNLGNLTGRLKLASGANLSVNDVGSLMLYGCCIIAIYFSSVRQFRSELQKYVLIIGLNILLISVMFLSGSRKSLYGMFVFYGVLLVLNGGRISGKRVKQFLVLALVLVIAVMLCSRYLFPLMYQTQLYRRLFDPRKIAEAAGSDDARLRFYRNAFWDFINHPLWGLGYNNYLYVHRIYTHSTYAEPLACSGVIGLLYLLPYASILRFRLSLLRITKKLKMPKEYEWSKQLFAFFIMFLFIGAGIPYIYKDIPCIVLGMMIASQNLEFQNIRLKYVEDRE